MEGDNRNDHHANDTREIRDSESHANNWHANDEISIHRDNGYDQLNHRDSIESSTVTETVTDGASQSTNRISPFRQKVTYLGCAVINAPRSETEIHRNMSILNDSPSAMDIMLVVPKCPEEYVLLQELASDDTQTNDGSKLIGSFPITRIIFCARGKHDSNERNCLAFTASHGTTFESGVIQCHVFRCPSPEIVANILHAFGCAFRKVPSHASSGQSEFTVIFESGLEIKEDTHDGRLSICPRDKDCFKFKVNAEKKICVALFQDGSSRINLNIEKCFGMVMSPGRNVRNSDMIPIGLLSMNRNSVPHEHNRKPITQWQIFGNWNPAEPLFEVLNTETARDTRVYFTIALDLVITGIREPVRFVFEAKAKITGNSSDKFWYIPSGLSNMTKAKPLQEQFHIQLRETANSEPDSRFDVISCYSTTQLTHQRHKLALRLKQEQSLQHASSRSSDGGSHRGSVTSLPTPSAEDDDDNDEPLPSGTGIVSKDCSKTELDGWSEVLSRWQSNLSSRPRQVTTLVRRGIPEALRGEVWQLLVGSNDENALMEQYRLLITRESPYEKNIERDINRTFPAHEYFRESNSLGQDSLFKLCKAYSIYDAEIGYCQGLSFLIAALLLHMPEEQTFCVLCKIMFNYGLRNLFRCGFEELHQKFYQLERVMDDALPELYSHFADLGVEAHMYASQWFLTLFTAKFPLHVVFPILDLYLLDGMDTIFQVALALLSISKKDLLALDFEGALKYFRVSLPKKFRTEENGKLLLRTAVAIKVKKLKKYEKEYQLWRASLKVDDPIERLEKENKRLLDSAMRLEQENEDLAQELLLTCNSKMKLRADLDVVEDKAETLNKELLSTRSVLVDVEDEKKRLEIEVNQLKEMCRRELERAETEIARNANIIVEYKHICSQLQQRFESEQSSSRASMEHVMSKVIDCERCAKLIASPHSKSTNDLAPSDDGEMNGELSASSRSGVMLKQRVEDLETELVRTKVALVEAECRNEELLLHVNSANSELHQMRCAHDESKNTHWFTKTLSSIREATKKVEHQSSISRENSKDFVN